MLCPVDKPEPPIRNGAQLILNDKYTNWDQELWEGEKIYYKCKNESLVIDNEKGRKQKEYICQTNGDYDTPDNMGVLWPECTEPPVDPSKSVNLSTFGFQYFKHYSFEINFKLEIN